MAEPKTTRTGASVDEFLAGVSDPQRRADAQALCALMTEATAVAPAMWGSSIVGFGSYEYRYGSGHHGQWPTVGFSPRKQSLTIYISDGVDRHGDLLSRLGKHSTGKSCLYVKRLSDVDKTVLRELVQEGFTRLDGTTLTPEQA